MWLFNAQGKLVRYTDPRQIIEEYFDTRYNFYKRRKEHQLAALRTSQRRLENRVRFIELVSSGKLTLHNKSRKELVSTLSELNFAREDQLSDKPVGGSASSADAEEPSAQTVDADADVSSESNTLEDAVSSDSEPKATSTSAQSYNYLLNMAISSLTRDRIASLRLELDEISKAYATLEKTELLDIWDRELDSLAAGVKKMYDADQADLQKYLVKTFSKPKRNKTKSAA